MESLIDHVKHNLAFFHLWTELEVLRLSTIDLLRGLPPQKLSSDDTANTLEYVLPVRLRQYHCGEITLEVLDQVFAEIQGESKKRLLLAIVNDDGTVVYYTVYQGLHKPKKN